MIFGMSQAQKEAKRSAHWRDKALSDWKKTFAILPRRLYDGQWTWFQVIEQVNWYSYRVEPKSLCGVLMTNTVARLPATNKREYVE